MQPQYLRNEFYQKKSPLFHVGSYMKKTLDENDQVSERLLSLVFKNISEKHIIAIQGVIHNFNPFNESLIETPFTLIEIPNFKPGTLFGETVYFKVHPEAVIFKIEIKRVTYTGFETETFEDNSYEKIERPLEPSNVIEKQYIFNKFNQGFEYIQDIKIEDAYYQCVCGTMNHIKNSVCIECRAPKETYIKIFKEEHIKKIISEDADLYVESVFKDSVVSFDMNEETIEKLIQTRGNTHIIEIVQKEKERFQELDGVIRPKVDNTIHIALFDRLMQKIDKVNKEIENKKQEELIKKKQEEKIEAEFNKKELAEKILKENILINKNTFDLFKKEIEKGDFNIAKETRNKISTNLLSSIENENFNLYKFLLEFNSKTITDLIFNLENQDHYTKTDLIEKILRNEFYISIKSSKSSFKNDLSEIVILVESYVLKNERKKKFKKTLFFSLLSSFIIAFSLLYLFFEQTILLDSNGGNLNGQSIQTIEYKNLDFNISLEEFKPLKPGYTFIGWSFNESSSIVNNLSQSLGSKRTLVAIWEINKYIITFNTDGGSNISSVSLEYNSPIKESRIPFKTGYTFKGWDSIPLKMPANNITINAIWEEKSYNLMIHGFNNSIISNTSVKFNQEITIPNFEMNDDYLFLGWYSDQDFENVFNTRLMPSNNLTIYGKFIRKEYKLNFNSEDMSLLHVDNEGYIISDGDKITKYDLNMDKVLWSWREYPKDPYLQIRASNIVEFNQFEDFYRVLVRYEDYMSFHYYEFYLNKDGVLTHELSLGKYSNTLFNQSYSEYNGKIFRLSTNETSLTISQLTIFQGRVFYRHIVDIYDYMIDYDFRINKYNGKLATDSKYFYVFYRDYFIKIDNSTSEIVINKKITLDSYKDVNYIDINKSILVENNLISTEGNIYFFGSTGYLSSNKNYSLYIENKQIKHYLYTQSGELNLKETYTLDFDYNSGLLYLFADIFIDSYNSIVILYRTSNTTYGFHKIYRD
jgi:hypothetical protein